MPELHAVQSDWVRTSQIAMSTRRVQRSRLDLGPALVSLHRLSIVDTVGAPKRVPSKECSRASTGHGGVRFDSGRHTVGIILLSRLLMSTDEQYLQRIAQSNYGTGILQRMREMVLEVARPTAPSLEMAQVQTLFNTVGATLKRADVYNGLLSLPSRLSFERARAVYIAVLDAVTSESGQEVGRAVVEMLTSDPNPSTAANADAIAAAFVSRVRELVVMHLGCSGGGSSVCPPAPTPPPQPPSALSPCCSFIETLEQVVSAHIGRNLSVSEKGSARAALDEGLSVLSTLNAEGRSHLLDKSVLEALIDADAAQLYACVVASTKSGVRGEPLERVLDRALDRVSAAVGASWTEQDMLESQWGAEAGTLIVPSIMDSAYGVHEAVGCASGASGRAPEQVVDPSLTEVRESLIQGSGRGLFASREVGAGTVVAGMEVSARMKRAAWDAYRTAAGLPHDAAIYVARSPLVFYDAGWVDAEDPPKWYMANHSTEAANMRMGLLDPSMAPRRQTLVWRTTRPVSRGEELLFAYGEVGSEWDALL